MSDSPEVLVVEDDATALRIVELVLGKLSLSSVRAASLREAEGILGDDALLRLIILDRGLPDGDGLAFCRKSTPRYYCLKNRPLGTAAAPPKRSQAAAVTSRRKTNPSWSAVQRWSFSSRVRATSTKSVFAR